MASGGWFHPPVAIFFVKNNDKLYANDFLPMLLKFYRPTLKKIQGPKFPRELSRDLFSTSGKRKFAIFEVFGAYLIVFNIFSSNLYGSKVLSISCVEHQKFAYKCSS